MNRVKTMLGELIERRQILLSASLLVLVAGFASGPSSEPGRYLILVHFGLFLLWQPVVQPNYRLGAFDLLLLFAVLTGFLLAMSAGLLAAWVMVIAAVIGGRSFIAASHLSRVPYLLAVGLLVLFLVLVLVPEALDLRTSEVAQFSALTQLGLPLLAVAIGFFPVESDFDPRTLGGIDLLSALMIFLVLAVSLLGALALMQVHGIGYFESLAASLLGMAGALFLLAWAWHPRLGHAGLGIQLSRRMLSSGLSFETWLQGLSALVLEQNDPETFLESAMRDLRRFPGIVGATWRYENALVEQTFGQPGRHTEYFEHAGLWVALHFVRQPGEGLLWQYNLMLLVLAEFYREKCQTRLLQLRSFEEAVHETGARLTHDVKNLLQSLSTLCFAAARPEADAASLHRLLRSQLPQISARLENTLEKLRQPEDTLLSWINVADWWQDACARHEGQRIRFIADLGDAAREVPRELYDSCLDNLLQNAIAKRQLEPAIGIHVELDAAGRLRVSDSGSAIPAELARALLRQPVKSEQGFGMGLYQARRLALRAGYGLDLVSNADGAVTIELYPAAGAAVGMAGEVGDASPSSRLTSSSPLPLNSSTSGDSKRKD